MNRHGKIQRLFLILLLGVGLTAAAQGQGARIKSGESFADRSVAQGELRLTSSILKEDYCFDGYSRRLRLSLHLNFTNIGTVPVLLDRKSSVVARTLISRNLKAAVAGKYVYDATYTYNSRQAGLRWSFPDEAFFVVLKPNESYVLKQELGLLLHDGTKDTEEDLHSGNYLLQMRIGTWYYPVPSEGVREQWRNKGYLWSKTMLSEPMPFTVLKVRNSIRCSPMR